MSARNMRGATFTHSDPAACAAENLVFMELIDAIVLGKQTGLTGLYGFMHLRIHGIAYRIVASRQDAEEIVSDVFMYVWAHAGQYCRKRGSVMGWLTVVTRNRALSPLGRQLVELAFLQELTHENIVDVVGLPLGTVKSHVRRALLSMRIPMAPEPVRLVG
jgi:DNA-directed RNA polymerase specialized sigma24 family protein